MKNIVFYILLSLFSFSPQLLSSQDKTSIKLLKADFLEYDDVMVKAQRLIGSVVFEHKGAIMKCDSAWLYEEDNLMKAFGSVNINQGDSIHLKAERLIYKGDENIAELFDNITLKDKEMTLTTDYLIYNTETQVATYPNHGKMTSSVNNNVLTSDIGSYYSKSKTLHFKKNVILKNPEYTMDTDTLQYNTESEQAFFYGPTTITSKEDFIYCENGWYDTMHDKAQFNKNAYLWSDGQQLLGDSLFYDRNIFIGEAFGDVALNDTLNDFSIKGDYGKYLEAEDRSFVTGHALFIQYMEHDTLNLHADTLLTRPDTLSQKLILAYPHVKFYKKDMQGACDSLSYSERDSLLEMFIDPVIWSNENQISGDKIEVISKNGEIGKLFCRGNAFMITENDSLHYNQIKGKNLYGFFKDNELHKVDVIGNGESIYYAKDDKDNSYMGVNKSTCSDITIYIKDQEVIKVNFKIQPNSAFYPLDKISAEELILKNFKWEDDRRPHTLEEIFDRNENIIPDY